MASLRLLCLLFTFTFATAAFAADLAQWNAAAPAKAAGVQLLQQGEAWNLESSAAGPVAAIKPLHDYYRRATYTVQLAQPSPDGAWLILSYLDKGYGLITLGTRAGRRGGGGVRAQDQWGITRLNTGKIRRAVFRLPPGSTELHVAGITHLSGVAVTGQKPPYEPAPMVEPFFKPDRPIDLVINSGADANTVDGLEDSLANLRNLLPLGRALGFNGVESYVKWNFVERERGVFDWSFYDAVVAECQRHGMRWFPLLIVGSAYALPDWFFNSPEHFRYKCLEHGLETDIPTIFHEAQVKYVRRFLQEFGKHYGSNPALQGIRLGPTANYGEAQYPATGNWGYKGRPLHTHLGYWVGDDGAAVAFRERLRSRYPTIGELNQAWGGARYPSFEAVKPFLPVTALNQRMRQDFSTWYMDAMTEWCDKWAKWAREAMPNVPIYQSSGGWGAVEIGTDYIAHTKSIAALKGGIRLTNENDSYVNNFCVTRPAASAARFYGAMFGTEPAGFGSRRGVMNRLYNIITNDGRHLFFYQGNLYDNDQAIDGWVANAPLLNQRAQPMVDVGVFYPDTANKLDDSIMRHLRGSTFFHAAYAMRSVMDYDFAGEQMILDGALDRFKVLVILEGRVTEKAVLEKMDQWVRAGGIVIFPLRMGSRTPPLTTVEEDASIFERWRSGDTGKGRLLLYEWHPELKYYMAYLRKTLRELPVIRPEIRRALAIEKPEDTYWSVLANGKLVLLSYGDEPAIVRLPSGKTLRMEPYTIAIE